MPFSHKDGSAIATHVLKRQPVQFGIGLYWYCTMLVYLKIFCQFAA